MTASAEFQDSVAAGDNAGMGRCVLLIGVTAWCAFAQTPPEGYGALPAAEGWYRGQLVTYRVYQGQALVEGDMLLGPVEDLAEVKPDGSRASIARSGDRYRWPDRTIPYEIDPEMPNQQRVLSAIEEWNTRTVIRLKPREGEPNFVRFLRAASGCNANVGMLGAGMQMINLADDCNRGNTVHEIGHAVGLYHTQARTDRAGYVAVLYENIQRPMWNQFDRLGIAGDDVGPYDFGAIMHYGQLSFNSTPRNAIQSIPPGIVLGQRNALSQAEIQAVARMYGQAPTDVVIDTYPSNLTVVVDGETYRTPKAFPWFPGETHSVSVTPRIGTASPNAEYRLARWSNGGSEAEHTFTVAEGMTIVQANYALYLRLRTGVAPEGAGAVTVSPASEDGFYPNGTLLQIRATPNDGFRFFRWSAGSGGATQLNANLQGNGSNPAELSIRGDTSYYVANFLDREFTVIDSTAPGTLVTVDGQNFYAPVHLDWAAGSAHTVSIEENRTMADSGIRYLFEGWSNGGERQQRLTVEGPLHLSAGVKRQFRVDRQVAALRVAGSPIPTVQNVELSPGGDGWYDEGSLVQIRTADLDNLPFTNWFLDAGGKANPQTVRVDAPSLVGANYMVAPLVSALSVVNDATQQPVDLAPGMLFTVYGSGIGGDAAVEAPDGEYPSELAGVAVFVGGERAGVVRVSKGAVTAMAPASLPADKLVTVAVESGGRRRSTMVVRQFASPGVYTLDGSGRGDVLVTPVARGQSAVVAVTGVAADGPVAVEVGGFPGEVVSLQPERAGRFLLEFRIPAEAPLGETVSLVISSMGARSQVRATLSIQE